MPSHNRGFTRRLARSSTADKTRALSEQARQRQPPPDDHGQLNVGLGVTAEGQVLMQFPKALSSCTFLPANARQLAAGLVEMANKAEGDAPAEEFIEESDPVKCALDDNPAEPGSRLCAGCNAQRAMAASTARMLAGTGLTFTNAEIYSEENWISSMQLKRAP